jgi:hypothetical protein
MTEALHAAFGWNPIVFRLWYLSGAVLVAAWIGQGTVELLLRRKVSGIRLSRILLALLLIGSIYATYKVFTADLEQVMIADEVESIHPGAQHTEQGVLTAAASVLNASTLRDGEVSSTRLSPLAQTVITEAEREALALTIPAGEMETSYLPLSAEVDGQQVTLSAEETRLNVTIDGQLAGYLQLRAGREMHGHAIQTSGVRVLTPFFNTYGLLTLVAGAVYSAIIFLRKRIMPNRVMVNVLIAAGALMPAMGGLFSRLGIGGFLYLGELLGAILMFAGFVLATTVPQSASTPRQASAEPVGG